MRILFRRHIIFHPGKPFLLLLVCIMAVPLFSAVLERMERCLYGVEPGVVMAGENFGYLLPAEVRAVVEDMALKDLVLPVEPCLERSNGKVIPGRTGRMLDVQACVAKILQAKKRERIIPELIKLYPQYSARDLEEANQVLGWFGTGFTGSSQRYTNIMLATSSLNYTVIWPGQTFSFNETVGPRTPERGYLPAPIILLGETDLDYGGGVCQVASTVYNAAVDGGLQITERHRHTRRVGYVPAGKDAAVTYGYLDLKFKNQYSRPVIIKSGLSRGQVWVGIYGRGEP